jgi:hypothetical protein
MDYVRFGEYLQNDPGVPLKPILKGVKKQETPFPVRHEREIHTDEAGNVISESAVVCNSNVLDGEKRLVLELWNEPGIGFEPDIEIIKKFAVRQFHFNNG